MHQDADTLAFEVVDDGTGFEAETQTPGAGFVNMSGRLGTLGGSLQVDSSPGRGTRVSGHLPVSATEDSLATPSPLTKAPEDRSFTGAPGS